MPTHAFLGTHDIEKSRAFRDATMGVPGHEGMPLPHGNAYGAYLRDPDGNKLCAFCELPAGA